MIVKCRRYFRGVLCEKKQSSPLNCVQRFIKISIKLKSIEKLRDEVVMEK
jgi:hypothetical protein